MDTALNLLNWRAHLNRTSVLPDVEVVLQVAERHAVQTGENTLALARNVCEIVQGFSPQLVSLRAGKGLPATAAGTGSVGLALAELRDCASLFISQHDEDEQEHGNSDLRPLHWMPDSASGETSGGEIAADIAALHALLASETVDDVDGDALLARLSGWCAGLGDLPISAVAFAPLPELIGTLSALNLRAFLDNTADLAGGIAGSVSMLRATARFNSFGLGPYLRNVGSLVRHSRDVFELAYAACDAAMSGAGGNPVAVQICVALLARHLKGALLTEVVDELGDLDARTALAILQARLTNCGDSIDLHMIMRLRDIALDNLDYHSALLAQRRICDARPGEALELEILGSIHASLGNTMAARQALVEALECDPGNRHILKRISALDANNFAPYTLTQGFGSPEGRRLNRQARRQAAPSQMRTAEIRGAVGVEFTF